MTSLNRCCRQLSAAVALATILLSGSIFSVQAQQIMPTPAMAKKVMDLTKGTWIQFRNYNGKQYIYFTHFFAWKCAIKEVHYSINSKDLAERFELSECNEDAPFNVDPKKEKIFLTFELGHAKNMSVQIVYKDDSKSDILSFEPCDVDRDQSCAKLIK